MSSCRKECCHRHPTSTNRGSGWYEANLVEELKKTLPNEKIALVDYSIHDIKAKILVSMGGGASYLAFFLTPGASALLLKRRCKVHDSFLFDNIPYIRKEYFDASNCTSDLEVFDYVKMAKSVQRSIQHYNADSAKISQTTLESTFRCICTGQSVDKLNFRPTET